MTDAPPGAPGPAPAPRAARLAGWALLALAGFLVLEIAVVAAAGTSRVGIFHVPAPRRWVFFAFASFAAGLFLAGGGWRTRRAAGEFAGRILLLLFGLGFAFLAAEAGLRVFLWRTQASQSIEHLGEGGRKIQSTHPLAMIVRRSANPRVIYELAPGLDVDFGHKRVRTNALGMRQDRDYPEAKPPGTVRIVGIGDSGMFGWNVEQEEPYLAVLEQRLNRRPGGVRYEVLNLGVPGYNTRLEVESLRDKGLRFAPDIVVVGWCDNDFQVPFFVPQEGQWTRRDISLLWLLLFDRARYADTALSRMATHGRDEDVERTPQSVKEASDVGGVRAALAELRDLGAERGFRVIALGAMRPEAVAIFRDLGIAFFNTRERIPLGRYPEEWAVYFIHPRGPGHAALAEELEQELVKLGWIK